MQPATSARARTATTSTDLTSTTPKEPGPSILDVLRAGELEPLGWLVGSSNNAMVVRVTPGDLLAVWKPTAGERPLFDFPLGTLTRREVAAYLVSGALGWGIVPPTLLRDGPHGEGMLQLWIEIDETADVVDMVNGDDARLRRIAVFDAIVNNTDRKAGHLLPVPGGHLHAVDHGVTFSIMPKLRTVLWAWEGEAFDEEELAGLERVRDALGPSSTPVAGSAGPGALAVALAELLFVDEIEATRARVAELLTAGVFPSPSPDWPAIPWPPY
ncbi:MAG: SCO1664 family protein [Candidatus Limnocylindrales bacterium]